MSTIINGVGRVGIRVAPQSGGGGGYTTRTQALINATGISDITLINAINTFDLGIISNNLPFGADDALYLGFLGNSTNNKYNFIDVTKYQLTFFGGWTFTNGMLANQTNTYAKTGWIPSARISNNNYGALGMYTRNNLASIRVPVGAVDTSNWYTIYPLSNKIYPSINDGNANSFTPARQKGGFDIARISSSQIVGLNDTNTYTITQNFGAKETKEIYLGTFNNNGTPDIYYSGNDLLCVYMSANQWTQSQLLTFSNLRLTLLTTLGLNV